MAEGEERICRAIDQRERDRMIYGRFTRMPGPIVIWWRGCMTISNRDLQGVLVHG